MRLQIGWQSVLRGSGQNILFRAKAPDAGPCISLSNACSNDKISSRVSDCEKTCSFAASCGYAAEKFYGLTSEGLAQIGQDVVDMLDADGQAHGVGPDAGFGQFRRAELGMGGGCRMDDQRFDVRHIGQQGKMRSRSMKALASPRRP